VRVMRLSGFLLGIGTILISVTAFATPPSALEFIGRGTQVYSCEATGSTYSWSLLGPDALMYDASGKVTAHHFYGPSWQANDGSLIKGKVLVANAAPTGPQDAPWLVLHIVSEQGTGIFARVTTIVRTDTRGGGAPTIACSVVEKGQTVKIPYSARYTFFSQRALDATPH
jgi:Protein of unknown function (DUF3455)